VPGLNATASANGFAAIVTAPSGFGNLLSTAPAGSTSVLDYIAALEATPGYATDVVIGFGNTVSPTGPTIAEPDYLHAITSPAGTETVGNLAALGTLLTSQQIASIDGGFTVLQNNDPGVTYSRVIPGTAVPSLLYDWGLSSATARGAGNDPNYPHYSGGPEAGGLQDNGTLAFAPSISNIPEPASLILLGIGGLGFLGFARRRR
jgi:hypothetical protein